MADAKKPDRLVAKNIGRLSEGQDSALDRAADALSRKRGTRVTRADVTREALHRYCKRIGVEWPR